MLGRLFGGSKGESAESLKAKGNASMQKGAWKEAESFYRQAIEADPNYMPAHYNLGNALREQHAYEEALSAYQRASELVPDDYEIFVNLGVTFTALARYSDAIRAFETAAQLAPMALEPRMNKGVALSGAGFHDKAIEAYDEILNLDPGCSIARYYRSMEYLLLGRWQEGFLDHESRLDLPGTVPEDLLVGKEEWDGSDLSGQTLLIYPEQGMGDMIHFLRYAPLCKAKGARVMVCCHPPLAALLKTSPEFDVVVPDGTPLPEPFDTYISVMSLPYALGRAPELPALNLNVAAIPNREIAEAKGLRVGVCWQGNPAYKRDFERSMSREKFWNGIAGIEKVSFFSLVIGDESEDFSTPLSPYISDFLDTANLVQQLDLVLTTDTSVAHLCGTLGIPTWVLLSYSPDWRWGLKGETTQWYPSVRLFRQPEPGNWTAILAEARQRIQERAAKG